MYTPRSLHRQVKESKVNLEYLWITGEEMDLLYLNKKKLSKNEKQWCGSTKVVSAEINFPATMQAIIKKLKAPVEFLTTSSAMEQCLYEFCSYCAQHKDTHENTQACVWC